MPQPRFQLHYWPLPFRGCFVSYLFAYCSTPLREVTNFEELKKMAGQHPSEQDVPFVGVPVLRDLKTNRTLSQMPAIVLYVAHELDLMPEDSYDVAMCMKILMDCNDVLMEICRYNGSTMWTHKDWNRFRSQRLPRWMQMFEESLKRGFIGSDRTSYADISVFALFGNMTRCLPELDADLLRHAPGVHDHCQKIGSEPSLAEFVAGQEREYGSLYCGGQIEDSIRRMLEMDNAR